MTKRYFQIYCFIIALIVTIPLALTIFQWTSGEQVICETELNGVTTIPEKPSLTLESIASGEFLSDFESFFSYNLVTRRTMTRVYNQVLYSLFHATDNETILVGQDGYLFEKAYATSYLEEIPKESEKNVLLQENVEKLEQLYERLDERGIPLIVRISPSKAEHYPEYLPSGYDRFVEMKQNGEYEANWYQRFLEALAGTSIPLYDGYDLMEELKADGKIVFAKGGTHWTLAPIAEYVNGLNELIEQLLGRKTSRMVIESEEVLIGQMGTSDDSDIWKICWNAISAEPDYPSPNISFSTIPGDEPLRVFTVGQSFTTVMLSAIYSAQQPVWDETYFSWYNSRVIQYPSDVPWGTQISEETNDFSAYLDMDVIIIDFMESGDGSTQFEFVNNMLEYLDEGV